MDIRLLAVGATAIGIYALVSGRLSRSIISGPMFFAAVGVVAVAAGVGEEPTGDVTGVAAAALAMTLGRASSLRARPHPPRHPHGGLWEHWKFAVNIRRRLSYPSRFRRSCSCRCG